MRASIVPDPSIVASAVAAADPAASILDAVIDECLIELPGDLAAVADCRNAIRRAAELGMRGVPLPPADAGDYALALAHSAGRAVVLAGGAAPSGRMLEMTAEAHAAVRRAASAVYVETGSRLPHGNWLVPFSDETVAQLEKFRVPGMSLSDTLLRMVSPGH